MKNFKNVICGFILPILLLIVLPYIGFWLYNQNYIHNYIEQSIMNGKDYEFEYGHLPSSWKQEGVKEREIFANYYSLVAFKDNQKLDFLKDNLPEIFDCCDSIKRKLHGEEE